MPQMLSGRVVRALISAAALFAAPVLYGQTTPTCNGLAATIVATTPGVITGTQGDDVIVGTSGDDQIFGLGGNDTICGMGGNDQISGGQGDDRLFGQAGNDTFLWFPGDGSDRVEGGSEIDTLQMSGVNISEVVAFSANGNRLRLTRNIANIVLDVAGVENVSFDARGGSDLITVNRLSGTNVKQVTLDLEGSENSGAPDGQADSIIVFGGPGNDQINLTGSGNEVNITGVGTSIYIRNPEGALDTLSVYGVDGDDRINAQNLTAGLIKLTVEGGTGNDTIMGSQGADILVGGEGDDTFVWTLGAPADLISGEAGTDSLMVLGSAVADNVILSPVASGIQVFNLSDNTTLEASVEQATFQAGHGADQIAVNCLAGTGLQRLALDLRPAAAGSAGDGEADTLTINGTQSADNIQITGGSGTVNIAGLGPAIVIQAAESARDSLTVNGGGEADVIDSERDPPHPARRPEQRHRHRESGR